jgi:hypothetical protein
VHKEETEGDRELGWGELDSCLEKRWKGELELNQGELDPCVEKKRTWEESSNVVCRKETNGEESSRGCA